jgi:hypothetical protein
MLNGREGANPLTRPEGSRVFTHEPSGEFPSLLKQHHTMAPCRPPFEHYLTRAWNPAYRFGKKARHARECRSVCGGQLPPGLTMEQNPYEVIEQTPRRAQCATGIRRPTDPSVTGVGLRTFHLYRHRLRGYPVEGGRRLCHRAHQTRRV